MIHSLISWPQLTRTGTPQFRVCRRALTMSGREFAIGTSLPVDAVHNRSRLRQLYEQRRIEPVIAPPNSKQAHRPPTTLSAPAVSALARVEGAVPTSGSTPPTPVSKSVPAAPVPVSDLPFESTPVPVRQEPATSTGKSSGGYRPARSK